MKGWPPEKFIFFSFRRMQVGTWLFWHLRGGPRRRLWRCESRSRNCSCIGVLGGSLLIGCFLWWLVGGMKTGGKVVGGSLCTLPELEETENNVQETEDEQQNTHLG